MPIEDFDSAVIRIGNDLNRVIAGVVVQAAFAALSSVVLGTAVGNKDLWKNPRSAPPGYRGGRARQNWQVGVDVMKEGEIPGVDPSGTQTIERGKAALSGYNLGPSITIVNNVPYIERLNNGHSQQSPAGFVQRAAQAAVESIEGAQLF